MASVADLPQELVDQIVNELHDDPHSLCTCALISPPFLPWSRHCLFSSVRVTASDLSAFGKLIESSPTVASHIHRLDIPALAYPKLDFSAILPVSLLTLLPNLTRIVTHCDPFDFRHLSPEKMTVLAGAATRLTSVNISIDRLWTLPAWAALLNGCPALTHVALNAQPGRWEMWTANNVALPMPVPSTDAVLRLHSLRVSGDCNILSPLGAWLLPQCALDGLQTFVLEVDHMEDYSDADVWLPLVRAAKASLRELTLSLHPPMPLRPASEPDIPPLCVATSFPHLRTLHLTDGPYARSSASLVWLATFLAPSAAALRPAYPEDSPLVRLSIDHSMTLSDVLDIPACTWLTLEDALLGICTPGQYVDFMAGGGVDVGINNQWLPPPSMWPSTPPKWTPLPPNTTPTPKSLTPTVYPLLHSLTFTGFVRTSHCGPAWFGRFSQAVRARLPRLEGRGVLVLRPDEPPTHFRELVEEEEEDV